VLKKSAMYGAVLSNGGQDGRIPNCLCKSCSNVSEIDKSWLGPISSHNTRDTTTFCSILDFKFLLLKVYTARKRRLPKTIFSLTMVLLVLIRLTGLFGRKHVITDKGHHVQDAR